MHRLLARLWRDDRGFSAAEFGLLLPILLMFSAGTIEYSRLILLTQKLQSSSFILADLTARDKTLSEEQLENIFLAIDNIVQPFEFADEGKAIVSSVGVDSSDQTVINWQRSGSGALSATSELGSEGGTADLPDDWTSARARRSSRPRSSSTSSRSSASAWRPGSSTRSPSTSRGSAPSTRSSPDPAPVGRQICPSGAKV